MAKQLTAKTEKILRATHGSPDNLLSLGDRQIECYVLEDGTAVLSGRGMQKALGLGEAHGGIFKGFISNPSLNKFIDSDLAMGLNSPRKFVRPGRGGRPANSYEATVLTKLCRAILKGRREGAFENNAFMQTVATEAEIIVSAFSDIGIIATIYEITGYESEKATDAYQKYLEKFIRKEAAAKVKQFPVQFFELMCDLKKWPYTKGVTKYIPAMGHVINDVIYSRLAPGVLDELQKVNPTIPEKKKRKDYHTQWLTLDIGIPSLNEHIIGVMALAKANSSWRKFKDQLARVYPVHNDPKLYLFPIDEMDKMMDEE